MKTIWLIEWEYGDHSGHGIIKGFENENDAKALHEILKEHAEGKQWYCYSIEVECSDD